MCVCVNSLKKNGAQRNNRFSKSSVTSKSKELRIFKETVESLVWLEVEGKQQK